MKGLGGEFPSLVAHIAYPVMIFLHAIELDPDNRAYFQWQILFQCAAERAEGEVFSAFAFFQHSQIAIAADGGAQIKPSAVYRREQRA